MDEQWRVIAGHDGYEVSNLGRVRSVDRDVYAGHGAMRRSPGRILKPGTANGGHQYVSLGTTSRNVHRLVLTAFVGPCPEGMEACHNDGNPANNTVDNLRWDTRGENTRDRVRAGTHHFAARTHCKHGHEFTPENTYTPAGGGRHCRACRRDRNAKYEQRKKSGTTRQRRTHCKRGHEFTAANTYTEPSKPNVRQCRTCIRLRREKSAHGC